MSGPDLVSQPVPLAPPALANALIASRLMRYADLLESQEADGFRVRAYRTAASGIEAMDEPLEACFRRDGLAGLIALKGIGTGIAAAIAEMLTTGQWRQLNRLEGELTPERLFATIPGVGPTLARRLADTLECDTLEQLEAALHRPDIRIPGIGARRRAALLAALDQRLARLPRLKAASRQTAQEPPVAMLLDADALYREKAAKGELKKIAPRRFNPEGAAWLPILHARRDDWHITALYSNTARAHELDRTRDWVVIFFHRDDAPEGQRTIVTETRGPLAHRRVVRGREEECRLYYDGASARAAV